MRIQLACAIAFLAAPAIADQIDPPHHFASVRDQIQEYIDDGKAPSIAITVVQNDEVTWAAGFGYANLEQKIPATADTIYRLASISKSFTGTGLMVLKDRGLIDLDAPANQYLTGEKLRSHVGSADQITLRRLANHTSGLPLHYNFFYPGDDPPPFDVTLRRYGFAYREPGTFWEYSNLAYGVLDHIIGNVSKTSWSEFMEDQVYGPLGMKRTSDRIRPEFAQNAAVQYGKDIAGRFAPVPHYGFDHPGASAVVSSANDMARYARMHMNNGMLDGVRLLTESSAIEMRTPTSLSPQRGLGYGVAFNDGKMLGQRTNSSSGGMPGVSTTMRLFPDDRNAIIVLTNGEEHSVTNGVMKAIAKLLYPEQQDESQPEPKNETTDTKPFIGKWVGMVQRDGEAIPVTLDIADAQNAVIKFTDTKRKSLTDIEYKDNQFVAKTVGRFAVSHAYQGESTIYLRLRRENEKLVGRLSALQPAYFALSHWIELQPAEQMAVQLHAAAKRGDATAITDLLARGADVDARSKYDATALSFAAQHGHSDAVKVLLEHGATVNPKDTFYNLTPLFWAAARGRTEIAKILVEAGATHLSEALQVACTRNYPETVAVLLATNKFDRAELSDIVIANPKLDSAITEQLIAAGADPQRKPPVILDVDSLRAVVGSYFSPDELLYEISIRGPRLEMTSNGNLIYLMEPINRTEFQAVGRNKSKFQFEMNGDKSVALIIRDDNSSKRYKRIESRENSPQVMARELEADRVVERPANWPSFRGVNATGVADGQFPPALWDVVTGENVRWKTAIPGLGHSCPVVWDDNIFLTTAISSGGDHSLRTGQYGDIDSVDDQSEHVWQLICLDKTAGGVIWKHQIHRGVPTVKRHLKSTHANPTPATDGRHIVVSLGSEGLYCFDLSGVLLWKRDLGKLASGWFYDDAYEWGFGSSPIIYDDLVVQQCDVGTDSFIAAYQLETGQQVWRTPRDENPSWSSPTIVSGPDRDELVTAASNFVRGYDPRTGTELWRMARLSEVTIPTPFAADGLIYVTSGYRSIKPIIAIRPGASGDITLDDEQTNSESVAWKLERGGPYMPTPLVYQGRLYVCPNNGLLSCYDAKTGERIYRKRLKNSGGYTASPVAADGRIYFTSESGEVTVVRAGPEFELIARNELGETCMSTPAISDGMIFVRTQHHLYGIGGTKSSESAPRSP